MHMSVNITSKLLSPYLGWPGLQALFDTVHRILDIYWIGDIPLAVDWQRDICYLLNTR